MSCTHRIRKHYDQTVAGFVVYWRGPKTVSKTGRNLYRNLQMVYNSKVTEFLVRATTLCVKSSLQYWKLVTKWNIAFCFELFPPSNKMKCLKISGGTVAFWRTVATVFIRLSNKHWSETLNPLKPHIWLWGKKKVIYSFHTCYACSPT